MDTALLRDPADVEIACAGCGKRIILHGGNIDHAPGWSFVTFTERNTQSGYTQTATLWGCPEHPQRCDVDDE